LACRKKGIEACRDIGFHHTFASRLGGPGRGFSDSQQLLGHSTVTVTMRYSHTILDANRNATEKLEGFSEFGNTLHRNAAITIESVTKTPAKCSCTI
jgi:integrase